MTQISSAIDNIISLLDEVGLNHSLTMCKAIIVEGGLSDHMKALQIPAFIENISDSEGAINRVIAEQNMLKARRALLAHVVDTLLQNGAIIENKECKHGPTVDEIYKFSFRGEEVSLVLLPN